MRQGNPNGAHNYLSSNRRYRRIHCRFKRVQLEAMVLAVVVTRVSHSGSRSDYCVMLEKEEESFVLCAAFRYAQGRNTFAMEIVVDHICKQLNRMSTVDIQQFLLEIDRRRRYGVPWGLQEEKHVDILDKELRECLK